ncbi:Aldehyde/histidinol dehydrogenase [Infundibulicybe gibba]|nr:Aldehyde/histidinol dehydrogenase [Infundibulicybe gibba]
MLLAEMWQAQNLLVLRYQRCPAKRFNTRATRGLHCPGARRAELLGNLVRLMDKYHDELSALKALDNGKTFAWADKADVTSSMEVIKYYAGWADKITGQTLETTEKKMIYTRHEPLGVVGQIIPWKGFPLLMLTWKVGPTLATGNAIVLKPSEFTPLTAIRMCGLIQEAGFPPGVVNIITGYGHTVGAAISSHMKIEKVAFTGSTLVGRKIMEAATKSNLKDVTLELGGKSPNIIYDDADLDQAVNWAAFAKSKSIRVGDPFEIGIDQGPQVSQQQYDRIIEYIDSGKKMARQSTLVGTGMARRAISSTRPFSRRRNLI